MGKSLKNKDLFGVDISFVFCRFDFDFFAFQECFFRMHSFHTSMDAVPQAYPDHVGVAAHLLSPPVTSRQLAALENENALSVSPGPQHAPYSHVHSLLSDPHPVFSLCVCDETMLVSASSEKGVIQLWDMRFFARAAQLVGHSRQVTAVAVAEDGTLFSAASDALKCWDLQTKQCVRTLPPLRGAVYCLAARNGQLFAAGQDTLIHHFDRDGKQLEPLKGHKG